MDDAGWRLESEVSQQAGILEKAVAWLSHVVKVDGRRNGSDGKFGLGRGEPGSETSRRHKLDLALWGFVEWSALSECGWYDWLAGIVPCRIHPGW